MIQCTMLIIAAGHAINPSLYPKLPYDTARSLALPNIPTIAESGLPGYEVSGWYGLVAPAATPKAAIARLQGVVQGALRRAEITDRLLGVGVEVVNATTDQFGGRINAELARWERIAKPLGIAPE